MFLEIYRGEDILASKNTKGTGLSNYNRLSLFVVSDIFAPLYSTRITNTKFSEKEQFLKNDIETVNQKCKILPRCKCLKTNRHP